ncbi:SAVED domain-containing protein (plasmid) [Nitratidesulfovibrio vulgaris]|nr:SAVED domain-containing protein [Nitratidesulfovibrio vulgaris]WCB48173.1 SAVED domain-containing protein [Nitratidesulfovibrio vulgaris]
MKQLEQRLTTLFIYLKGYDNMEERFPIDVIPAKYRYGKAFHLRYDTLHKTPQGALEEIKRISGDIARYVESNAAVSVKIFVAGRAFVPLQYAAGRVLGTRPEFEVMDFDRETGRWHFLDELDDGERINLLDPANAERVKESRQAALVLPFTANISNEQLPEGLRDVVYRFELEKGPRQDSMASKEKMEAILITVNQCIRNLRAEVDVLHVFAAVSTSTAVRLGCLFQSNIYPETRVYQFDTRTGGYTWALRLLADKMEIVEDSSVLYQLNRV